MPHYIYWTHCVVYDSHLPIQAKIEALIENNEWRWPSSRSDELVNIAAVSELIFPNVIEEDLIAGKMSKRSKFSIQRAWKARRDKKARVDWFKATWRSLFVPKHSFIYWLTILNRLVT